MPSRKPDRTLTPEARGARLLARREHSAAELTRKLIARGVDEAQATAAVEKLKADGWQDDARYAEAMVRHRSGAGYGPRRIEAELRQAGVSETIAETALAGGPNWNDLAARVHARRFRGPPRSGKARDQQYRYLLGRGYEPEQVRHALSTDVGDTDPD